MIVYRSFHDMTEDQRLSRKIFERLMGKYKLHKYLRIKGFETPYNGFEGSTKIRVD